MSDLASVNGIRAQWWAIGPVRPSPAMITAEVRLHVSPLGLSKGSTVWLSVKAVEIDLYANPAR